MALVIGNKTYDRNTPSSTTRTFSHTQNVGADGYLYILIACPATTVTGVTYNGVSMTNVGTQTPSVYGTQWTFWKLASPTTGANNVVVTFATAQYNPVSTYVVSTTGSAGNGNVFFDNTASSPNTGSITVSNNSVVMCGLMAGNGVGHVITVDGSLRPLDFTHNINNYTSGALSAVLTSGSKTTSIAGTTSVAGYFMEILEAGGGGSFVQGNMLLAF